MSSGGWQSLTTPLILGTTSDQLEVDPGLTTSASALASGDIRYVGWSSTAPYVEALGADPQEYGLLNIGVATQGEWASLGLAVIPVIDTDVDGDGTYDLESYVWKLDPSIDLTVVSTFDLHAPASAPAVDIQPINGELGDVDTGVFDSNVFVAPIGLGAVGIEPGDTPTVSVWTYSPYGQDDVVDEADPFTVDPYAPPFWFENDRDSLVSSNGTPEATIPVHRSADAATSQLLVFHHHNVAGKRVQVLTATVPTATTTTLSVVGGSSYGDKAVLEATLAPTSAKGTVAFREGTRLIAVADVRRGVASAAVQLGLGTHTITASFVPARGSSFLGSTSKPVSVTVAKSATTTKVTVADGTVRATDTATGRPGKGKGPAVAVVTVTGATAAPSGTVTLTEGTKVLGTGTLKVKGLVGTVSITLPRDLAPGAHTVKAAYAGSKTTDGSQGSVTFTMRR